MTANDTDLAVLREVTADVAGPAAEPSADAVARTWARLSLRTADPPARPRVWSRKLLVPAIAAAAVAVILLATVALRPGHGLQVGASPLPPTPSADRSPAEPTSTPVPAGTVAVTEVGTTVGSVPVGRVIEEMVAAAASVEPVILSAGELLYVRMEVADWAGRQLTATRVHEWWVDPNGMTPLKIVNDGRDMGPGSDPPAGPPSLVAPTPEWLASLSTDPAVLYDMLVDLNAGVKLGGAHYVMKELAALYRTSDPVLTPAVRAAFYRALGEVDGLSATEVNVAGRKLYRMHQGGQNVSDLLLDPATGQVAGVRYSYLGSESVQVESIELWYRAVVREVGQTP